MDKFKKVKVIGDGKPLCLRNVLARLHELPEHDRVVWLKGIMDEFELGFSHAKWREGYEQGKFEGAIEREKVVVPQFVAERIEYFKKSGDWDLFQEMDYLFGEKEISEWLENKNNQETLALAWIYGFEVEKEKRYIVRVKGIDGERCYLKHVGIKWIIDELTEYPHIRINTRHTRKELEQAGFGWVFDCEGIEIEELEDDSKI